MEITHSYEGLSQEYFKSRKGAPKFAAFVVSRAGLDMVQEKLLTVLELGVGSGQQTEFVEKQLKAAGFTRYKILAFDKSPDQLSLLKSRIKNGEISKKVIPIQQDFDGTTLPIETRSVDLVYMAWVLHHLSNKQAVLNDIARITRKGGRLFMYQVTIEDLKNHPLEEYFPMVYEYDKQRYPALLQLKQMFIGAGFTFEKPCIVKTNVPQIIDRHSLEGVANTSVNSVLRMIKDNDPSAFSKGVNLMKKEVERGERSGKYRSYIPIDKSIFWGVKL